jgi:multidrug resistance protein
MQEPATITPKQKKLFAIMANFIVPIAGMSTDIYMPSLPGMSAYFDVSKTSVQLTVTFYVLALGIFQLIAGPISDAYGRKKLLLLAVVIQIFSIVGILISPSIHWLIAFRFMQGAGAGLMIVPARAMLNDIFSGPELKKQFNYMAMSFALGPIVAPFLGGYIEHYIGWKANFGFILIYGLLAFLLLVIVYRETIAETYPFSIRHLWENYHTILGNKFFVFNAVFISCLMGYSALFNVTGPFIVQVLMKKSAITYGHVALTIGVAWLLGNTTNRILFNYDKHLKSYIGLGLTLLTIVMFVVFANIEHSIQLSVLMPPVFITILLSGFLFGLYVGECLTIFTKLAASANACLFGIIWISYAAYTFAATFLKAHSLLPLALMYMVTALLSLIFFFGTLKGSSKR